MKFEEIPKRKKKRENKIVHGFRYRLSEMTNIIGDSSFYGLLFAVFTPILLIMFSLLLLMVFYVLPSGASALGIVILMISMVVGVAIGTLVLLVIYAYLAYIAIHQIKYDINRITGVVIIVYLLLSLPILLFTASLFGLSIFS